MIFDPVAIRHQFPIFSEKEGKSLIYLDSAGTAQKPSAVMDAMQNFYAHSNANVHRGMHALTEESTVLYEEARQSVRDFLRAKSSEEIILTKGTTEGINLVARSWGEENLRKDDTVILSILEHHSNIIPWLQLKEKIEINVEWIGLNDQKELDISHYETLLKKENVKLVSVTGLSNVTGVHPPLKEMIAKAHKAGALALVDASQLIAHRPIDVQKLDCDFLAFSGHKLYGPTGIGVLYGKKSLLESMPPFLGGGNMVDSVSEQSFTSADLPAKFEAGTPPIAQAIGLNAAIQWLTQLPREEVEKYEKNLLAHALDALLDIDGLNILGPADADTIIGCASFTLEGIHPHDLTEILGQKGICLRAGHHCAQPLHKKLGITASTRVSVALYNTQEEIDALPPAIEEAKSILSKS